MIFLRALVLCDDKSTTENYKLVEAVLSALEESAWEGEVYSLKYDNIKPCLGCFSCWVKTPGLCIITDDCPNAVSKNLVQVDAVILLSEIAYGGFSPDIKAFLDRAIPNVLPFFETYQGEMHHKRRYRQLPSWLAIGYGETTAIELDIFRELAKRNALNLQVENFHCITARGPEDSELIREEIASITEAMTL